MSSIKGKCLCFTGTLQNQTRAQATSAAKKVGAKVAKSITGSVDIVVAGAGAGAKLATAQDKGCEVWSEEQFIEACNDGSSKGSSKKKKASAAAAGAPPAKKTKKTAKKSSPPPVSTPTDATDPKKKPSTVKKEATQPATPATPGGSRRVMRAVQNADGFSVVGTYDAKLMLSDQTNMNSNKFYKLQLLQNKSSGKYFVATNWGRLGEPGKSQLKGPHDEEKGIKEFEKVFRSKTRNDWGQQPFERYADKYQMVETTNDDGDDEGGDQALGRLTESQINKGQAVLKEIRDVLEAANASYLKKKDSRKETKLGELSNDFYSLIPTKSGRQRPPKLNNLEIITEKEGLLEFWLRMGFEEVTPQDVSGSPIEGVMKLPVPSTLVQAASAITDNGSIKSSQTRGKELAKSKAGSPIRDMSHELYASILLYTGNSIYRELNRCLRLEWRSVPKYWNYLRLYFAAMDCMPKKSVTLWRGIAADLFDEYEPGKIITWWTVSSCTSDKSVAENFMNQLGGTATLLTLHTKTASDISCLSFFPHERESLLNPGTKLRVLNRSRRGKVAEIEVEEVLDDEQEKKIAAQ